MKENEALIGDLKDGILAKISDLQAAMETEDTIRIKNAIDTLQTSLHEVSSRMYGQQQGGQPGYQGPPPGGMGNMPPGAAYDYGGKTQDEVEAEQFRKASGQDDDVVDAEYT